jgi:hypothetical protein
MLDLIAGLRGKFEVQIIGQKGEHFLAIFRWSLHEFLFYR